ncbi:MAG: CDP-alcohol phosphatidyltransferase family protein [Ardenticatenaceae bacterium]|nr:CDP-alcohol phosphatidyltransferase family protein [Ardenticatenaceae bacterium]MCB9445383.1 CDP-alcohol phosphatidyltransferase family protein [Ardenticatenaceae bacterium]
MLDSLQRRWLATAVLYCAVLGLGYSLLVPVWPYAGRWGAIAGLVMIYGLWVLWNGLSQNHRAGETAVLSTLGWGNGLTLMRGLFISLIAGFLFSPWPQGALAWLPMLLYTTADIADYLDGYLARITHHATVLGAQLDMEFDGLGMLIVSLLAVWYGQLPWWYLSLGLARYLFVFGLWWREKRHLPVYEMTPSVHRRIFAGFQMGFMSAILWPILPPAGTTIAGTIFAGATAVSFLRDWLVAIGWLNPHSNQYQQIRRRIYRLTTYWLPPFLRVGLMIGTAVILTNLSLRPVAWTDLFVNWHLPVPALLATGWMIVLVLAGTAVTLGIMGRLLSLLLVFPLGFDIITRGVTPANGLALACVIVLMLLGTGALSLWQPEKRFMARRAGE